MTPCVAITRSIILTPDTDESPFWGQSNRPTRKIDENTQMSATEQAIRQAAIELIALRGYDAMTLRGLAARAGVNTSTLYLYYKGKQELLSSLVIDYYEQIRAAWCHTRPSAATARCVWAAFVRSHVTYHLHHLQHGPLAHLEIRRLEETEQERAELARARYLDEIQAIICQGVAEKTFECPAPKLYARMLFNLLTQSGTWYQESGRLSQDEITWHYFRITSKILEPATSR